VFSVIEMGVTLSPQAKNLGVQDPLERAAEILHCVQDDTFAVSRCSE
jgi:hypothetical protein